MDYRQPSSNAPRSAAAAAATPDTTSTLTGNGNALLSKILAGVLILAALTFIAFYVTRAVSSLTADSSVKKSEFQAVFLTNGQVYFGKYTQVDSSYVKLTNIYYLQVSSSASTTQTVQPKASDATSQQVSLAKLGGELHGPEDEMFISRDQVLFWENLKPSGKVSEAIANYEKTGGSTN